MAGQINEYQPETGAQGAVGGVTPNLEAVSLFGRGVEHVGASLEQAGDVVHRRQAQQEVSQVYGQFAQARADWNVKLKQGLRDGSLDPDKFDQDYADYVNKAGEGLQTAEGKDFFNRQANRLGGSLMQNAIVGKARIAGEQAYADISNGVNVHVANLHSNPEDFHDAADSTQELIAAKQADGTLTPEQGIRLKKEMMAQLAEATVRGYADRDPGQDAQGNDNVNLGKQFLDHKGADGKGPVDDYVNEAQRNALYTYIKQADNQRRIEADRKEQDADRALRMQGLHEINANFNGVIDGTFGPKQIKMMNATGAQKAWMMGEYQRMANLESATDKRALAGVYDDLTHGHIGTFEELIARRDELEKSGHPIAPQQMPFLINQLNNTPDGVILKGIQKRFYAAVDKNFNIHGAVGGGPMPGAVAAGADLRMEIMNAENSYVQSGKSRRDFWTNTNLKDPWSPYAIAQRHQITFPQMLSLGNQQAQFQQTGAGQDSNTTRISNSPTGELAPTPPSAPLPQQNIIPEEKRKKPGESIMDYKKRMGISGPVAPIAPATPAQSQAAPDQDMTTAQAQSARIAREDEKARLANEEERKKDEALNKKIQYGKAKKAGKGASSEFDF